MIHRVWNITSGNFLDSELGLVKNIFLKSGYRLKILDQIFVQFRKRFSDDSMEAIGCFPKILSFGLEYVNRHSTSFVNKIRNSMGEFVL